MITKYLRMSSKNDLHDIMHFESLSRSVALNPRKWDASVLYEGSCVCLAPERLLHTTWLESQTYQFHITRLARRLFWRVNQRDYFNGLGGLEDLLEDEVIHAWSVARLTSGNLFAPPSLWLRLLFRKHYLAQGSVSIRAITYRSTSQFTGLLATEKPHITFLCDVCVRWLSKAHNVHLPGACTPSKVWLRPIPCSRDSGRHAVGWIKTWNGEV